ncbi:hypothetical protein VCB98_11800 [Gammaproteobacteria bacterium AB-CW1]|uniref:Uncharacterized protein n=1 Tax=Natronospira elongata TaxID=3110268 RepID=A0AAP6MND6_9GAMM|nr:hypothetical protein [Gammaproteobacteria bacterium AB-CW1]
MELFASAGQGISWINRVVAAFFRVRPATTAAVVVFSVLSKITHLLAFFIPLKVLLLMGTPGVPRYFRFFIEPEDRLAWAIGLSIGAVVCYALSLALDAAVKRLTEAGSMEVLQGANELAVASKQRKEAQTYYARFSEVYAGTLFAVAGLAVMALVTTTAFLVLLVLLLAQLLMTALVLRHADPVEPGAFARFIQKGLSNYLTLLASINFLTCFFVLLVPLLLGHEANILFLILSVLVLRQSLSNASSAIRDGVDLIKQRRTIDPLVFRDEKAEKAEAVERKALRELFHKQARESMARERLGQSLGKTVEVEARWVDSTIKGANTFTLILPQSEDDGKKRYFQQQVFPYKKLHFLEHEEYLFEQVSRRALWAPEVYSRYEVGQFSVQICDYGLGRPLTADEWSERFSTILGKFWSIAPEPSLVSAFETSRPTLPDRLTEEFVQRVGVAVDTQAEMQDFELLVSRLEQLREKLRAVPQHFHNPDLNRNNVAPDREGNLLVMAWGRWSIEPFGAGAQKELNKKTATEVLSAVREHRKDLTDEIGPDDVMRVADCAKFEKQVNAGMYKAALRIGRKVGESLADDLAR